MNHNKQPPQLGDPDITLLSSVSIKEEDSDPKPGISFVVGGIEIVMTTDQLRALAAWAES